MDKILSQHDMAQCFNEWMRLYIEDPKSFDAEFVTVIDYLKDQQEGREPTYGETCAAMMIRLDTILSGRAS